MSDQFQNIQKPDPKDGKSRRGFASMDKDRHKLVSAKGGKTTRKIVIEPVLSPKLN